MKRMLISSVALQVNKSEEYLLGMVNYLRNKHKERDKQAQGKSQTSTGKATNKQSDNQANTRTLRQTNKDTEKLKLNLQKGQSL